MQIIKGKELDYQKYLIKNVLSLSDEPETVKRKSDGKMVKMPAMPNSYILGILLATELVGEALDDGKAPEEAEKKMNGHGLTGFMAGAVAETIAGFHPRGDEFRKWWNQSFGIKPEDDKGGVVNPAIVTIKHDITKGKKAE